MISVMRWDLLWMKAWPVLHLQIRQFPEKSNMWEWISGGSVWGKPGQRPTVAYTSNGFPLHFRLSLVMVKNIRVGQINLQHGNAFHYFLATRLTKLLPLHFSSCRGGCRVWVSVFILCFAAMSIGLVKGDLNLWTGGQRWKHSCQWMEGNRANFLAG